MVLIFSVEMWLGVEPLGKVPPGGAVGMAAEMALRGRTGRVEGCVAAIRFRARGQRSKPLPRVLPLGESAFRWMLVWCSW